MDGFLRSNCTSTEQECVLQQSDVGVNDNKVQPEVRMDDSNDATTQQVTAREEFARLTKMRQRQGTIAWAAEQNNQFERGRSLGYHYFSEKRKVCLCTVLLVFPFVFCLLPIAYFFPCCLQIAEAGTKGDMSYLDAPDA